MAPALKSGDNFIARLGQYGGRLPARGDIIVFPCPEDRSKLFVRRVMGLPGDRVQIKDKTVFVNGKRLADSWGVHLSPTFLSGGPRDVFGPVSVPERTVFVLGDNRDYCTDSRYWGYVETKDIQGIALFIYWSDDWGKIGKQLR